MTKEELKQEAEKWVKKEYPTLELNVVVERYCKAYLAGAEPREKRIEELEKDKQYFSDSLDKQIEATLKLQQENAELDCQKNRNKFCYSCVNATERCFRNEISCPCDKYKSYKDENAELKGIKDVATLIRANNDTVVTLMQLNNKLVSKSQQLTKAKEIILRLYNAGRDVLMCRVEEKAYDNLSNAINDKSIEKFLSEVEK